MPRFKTTIGHDWGVVEASSMSVAERSVKAFFGIRGSDHETKTEETTDAVGHSGQALTGEKVITIKVLDEKASAPTPTPAKVETPRTNDPPKQGFRKTPVPAPAGPFAPPPGAPGPDGEPKADVPDHASGPAS